jgi:hypothetical protein
MAGRDSEEACHGDGENKDSAAVRRGIVDSFRTVDPLHSHDGQRDSDDDQHKQHDQRRHCQNRFFIVIELLDLKLQSLS